MSNSDREIEYFPYLDNQKNYENSFQYYKNQKRNKNQYYNKPKNKLYSYTTENNFREENPKIMVNKTNTEQIDSISPSNSYKGKKYKKNYLKKYEVEIESENNLKKGNSTSDSINPNNEYINGDKTHSELYLNKTNEEQQTNPSNIFYQDKGNQQNQKKTFIKTMDQSKVDDTNNTKYINQYNKDQSKKIQETHLNFQLKSESNLMKDKSIKNINSYSQSKSNQLITKSLILSSQNKESHENNIESQNGYNNINLNQPKDNIEKILYNSQDRNLSQINSKIDNLSNTSEKEIYKSPIKMKKVIDTYTPLNYLPQNQGYKKSIIGVLPYGTNNIGINNSGIMPIPNNYNYSTQTHQIDNNFNQYGNNQIININSEQNLNLNYRISENDSNIGSINENKLSLIEGQNSIANINSNSQKLNLANIQQFKRHNQIYFLNSISYPNQTINTLNMKGSQSMQEQKTTMPDYNPNINLNFIAQSRHYSHQPRQTTSNILTPNLQANSPLSLSAPVNQSKMGNNISIPSVNGNLFKINENNTALQNSENYNLISKYAKAYNNKILIEKLKLSENIGNDNIISNLHFNQCFTPTKQKNRKMESISQNFDRYTFNFDLPMTSYFFSAKTPRRQKKFILSPSISPEKNQKFFISNNFSHIRFSNKNFKNQGEKFSKEISKKFNINEIEKINFNKKHRSNSLPLKESKKIISRINLVENEKSKLSPKNEAPIFNDNSNFQLEVRITMEDKSITTLNINANDDKFIISEVLKSSPIDEKYWTIVHRTIYNAIQVSRNVINSEISSVTYKNLATIRNILEKKDDQIYYPPKRTKSAKQLKDKKIETIKPDFTDIASVEKLNISFK